MGASHDYPLHASAGNEYPILFVEQRQALRKSNRESSALARSSLTTQHASFRTPSPFAPGALELRLVALDLRIAEAEIADEPPWGRNIEDVIHARWVENRYPAQPDALRARREPHHAHGRHDRIFSHFRHRPSPKAVSDLGRAIGERRELARSLFEPRQFELGEFGGQPI